MGRAIPFTVENAKIMFRNFSGNEMKYNKEGDRNFSLIIDEENMSSSKYSTIQDLVDDGWNVKILPPKDPDDTAKHILKVKVKYGRIEPEIYMGTEGSKRLTRITEETVSRLDYANIVSCDVTVSPYTHDEGVSAYLSNMVVIIRENLFSRKYSDYEFNEPTPILSLTHQY